jgi:glycosyltransferase involved in cell wall biosynthesis
VCYCHSPFRYAWHERGRALLEVPSPLRRLTAITLERIRRWDLRAAHRVSRYVANSEGTRQRIADFYGRDAAVVHPPVETERFDRPPRPEDWFLIVSELVPHKRIDLALDAARRAGVRMRVVGDGPERARLEAAHGDVAEFLGRVDDETLEDLYSRARALVMPNVEEFGIAGVEAQAAGRPVLAAAAGGVLETVLPGRTGVLVPPGDVGELARAMRETPFDGFDAQVIRAHAGSFSVAEFQRRLGAEVNRQLAERSGTLGAGSPSPVRA